MRGSVLVLGAGVAGMRAALELLYQGFKVFLVEEEAEIGGTVARLHRLYPTGEHAACAQRALTLDLLEHPRATILTSSELTSLEGRSGSFDVTVRQRVPENDRRSQDITIHVGAIIVATGLVEEKGDSLRRLGCGERPDVWTALEFERQLSGLGPTGGVVRLDDGMLPRRIAWIVGREKSPLSFLIASGQARAFLDRQEEAHVAILHEGRRTDERLCREAEERGVEYLQASSIEVRTVPLGGLVVRYVGERGENCDVETDLLVVSVPLVPGSTSVALARIVGGLYGAKGFLRRDSATGHAVRTGRDGVFVCGSAEGTKGIAESVVQACAAASQAAALLAPAREREPEGDPGNVLPVEAGHPPRIAVLIDQGDPGVAEVLDLDGLAEYSRSLPDVAHVEAVTNARVGSTIRRLLGTGGYNRLVVAGPSPTTHEPLFQRLAVSAGLNPYLVELVNLDQQCARVHSEHAREANRKARVLVHMGVTRARQLEPLEKLTVGVHQTCLVIGGGPAGLACASRLAEMGLTAHLVERTADLEVVPGNEHPLARDRLAATENNERVKVHRTATVGQVRGYVGDFHVDLSRAEKTEQLEVGAIVLASETAVARNGSVSPFEASLGLERDEDGFYLSTQGILNPLDFTTEGVFLCGPARAALEPAEAVVDGEAAASRAACYLASPTRDRSAVISEVEHKNCDGCAYCVEPCPTRSITLLEFVLGKSVKKVVEVNEASCIGCGICMATCPKDGIFVRHYRPGTFADMVQAALEPPAADEKFEPRIVCFSCNRCAYPGADAAGILGLQYPPSVRIIRMVCAGMIHPNIITDALTRGADGVLLCGCPPGECRSREGIRKAQARTEGISLLLEDFGLEEERFRLEFIAASEGRHFARVVEEMTQQLTTLGPSPYGSYG